MLTSDFQHITAGSHEFLVRLAQCNLAECTLDRRNKSIKPEPKKATRSMMTPLTGKFTLTLYEITPNFHDQASEKITKNTK
jgi:hypothetical protein